MRKLITIFKIPELSQKIGITLLFLITYRIGYHIPLPMLDQSRFSEFMRGAQSGAFGQVLGFVSMFSGGALSQATIFGWGGDALHFGVHHFPASGQRLSAAGKAAKRR